jgi:hypothetical protein
MLHAYRVLLHAFMPETIAATVTASSGGHYLFLDERARFLVLALDTLHITSFTI